MGACFHFPPLSPPPVVSVGLKAKLPDRVVIDEGDTIGCSYDHIELLFYLNGTRLDIEVTQIRGSVCKNANATRSTHTPRHASTLRGDINAAGLMGALSIGRLISEPCDHTSTRVPNSGACTVTASKEPHQKRLDPVATPVRHRCRHRHRHRHRHGHRRQPHQLGHVGSPARASPAASPCRLRTRVGAS